MATASVGVVFQQMFRVSGESADTLNAVIYDSSDNQVGTSLLQKRTAGYLFTTSFASAGLHTVQVTASDGTVHYDTVTVGTGLATANDVTAAKNELLGHNVIIKETAFRFKQNIDPTFVAGGAVGFSFNITLNGSATTQESGYVSGTWVAGNAVNYDTGHNDDSYATGEIYTFTNGTHTIVSLTSDVVGSQNQATDADKQYQLTTASKSTEIQANAVASSSGRELLSIRNFTVQQDDSGYWYLTSGDIYRTISLSGEINAADTLIGSISGSAPISSANFSFKITNTSNSEFVEVIREPLTQYSSYTSFFTLLHEKIVEAANSNSAFIEDIPWTYSSSAQEVNTHQPDDSKYSISISLNNTDGDNGLSSFISGTIDTTATLSAGLSDAERDQLQAIKNSTDSISSDYATRTDVNDARDNIINAQL